MNDPTIHYFNHYYMENGEKKTLLYWSPENVRLNTDVQKIKDMRPHIVLDGHLPYEKLAEVAEVQHRIYVKWLETEALKELELEAANRTTIDFLPKEKDAEENPKKEN
jgi:hypothetical protein